MQEFALHVTHDHDYRFKTPKFDQIVKVLRGAYMKATSNELEVQEVGDAASLARNMMTKVALP